MYSAFKVTYVGEKVGAGGGVRSGLGLSVTPRHPCHVCAVSQHREC